MKADLILRLVLIVIICLFTLGLRAFTSDFQAIIHAYEKGEVDKCAGLLGKCAAEDPEEQALVLYYKGLLSPEVDSVKAMMQSAVSQYPRTAYGQKARLELGSLALLERNYSRALDYFNGITDPGMPEKHFWIANAYYQKGEYSNAINSGNQFIRLERSGPDLEDANYLIADAYISLNQYNNAISTLKKLLSQPDLIHDEQYLRYRYGYAAEMLGNRSEAVSQYRQGYEINRFSQLAFLIEDRVFEMHTGPGPGIDLSFLYPHSELPPPDVVLAEQNKRDKLVTVENPDSIHIIKQENLGTGADSTEAGLYLQAGRFSVQANAERLGERIRKLGQKPLILKSTQFKETSWLVIVGPYQTQLNAVSCKQLLKENEIESFIIQR